MDAIQTIGVDPGAEGKQFGHCLIPSTDRTGSSTHLPVPVCIIQRGSGPTITFTGGLRGDETVGPVALTRLAQEIDHRAVTGRIVLLPSLNINAVLGGTPDDRDQPDELSGRFPGTVTGSTFDRLAAVLMEHFLAPSSLVVHITTGGSLYFDSMAAMIRQGTAEQQAAGEAAMIAFGAPNSVRLSDLPSGDTLGAAVLAGDGAYMTTRLGGAGAADAKTLSTAITGCNNVLIAQGVLDADFTLCATRMLRIPEDRCTLVSPARGLTTLTREIGRDVYRGDVLATIIDPARHGAAALELGTPSDGVLLAGFRPALARPGNCLAIIAEEMPR